MARMAVTLRTRPARKQATRTSATGVLTGVHLGEDIIKDVVIGRTDTRMDQAELEMSLPVRTAVHRVAISQVAGKEAPVVMMTSNADLPTTGARTDAVSTEEPGVDQATITTDNHSSNNQKRHNNHNNHNNSKIKIIIILLKRNNLTRSRFKLI